MPDPLSDYCADHTTPLPPLFAALERDTFRHALHAHMIAGPYLGQLLRLFSLLVRPRRILEVGTFTGYSALCLAEGLPPDGHLHTIEVNDELAHVARRYIREAGFEDRITLHVGDAAAVVPTLDAVFDLVLLDAGKLDYQLHYDLVLPKMRPGALLLADNVLWDGKVVANAADATAQSLRAFNDFVQADPRVDNVLLPVRDGVLVVRVRA